MSPSFRTPVLVQWCHVMGLYLVLVGLIGVKKDYSEVAPIPHHLNPSDFSSSLEHEVGYTNETQKTKSILQYKKSVDRIVLVIIDAMRMDFVTEDLPFTVSLLDNGYGCFFKANVKSPTVTLPRIKMVVITANFVGDSQAIVSGDVSTYWDIIHNFNAKEITQDNFIWHAVKDLQKKIVFYGDDTWVSLFPSSFSTAEGVSSFFVTDFYEVDDNITRHLNKELRPEANWDMMILHYLGLDHIGHVHGPKSTLIPGKLREMDLVVKRIYEYLSNQRGGHSMIIVCGDHGMANVGGHGGNSYHETTTPLLILSTEELPNCFQKNWRNLDSLLDVKQIDMAPTVSAFWGMIFPAASAGKVIWPAFGHLTLSQQLSLAHYNALQLNKFTGKYSIELFDVAQRHAAVLKNDTGSDTEGPAILKDYQSIIDKMSSDASDQLGQQNIVQMTSGTLLCLHSTLLLYLKPSPASLVSLAMSVVIGVLELSGTAGFVWPQLLLLGSSLLICAFNSYKEITLSSKSYLDGLHWVHYLVPLLFFSSSFVEEEQFLWYYLWTTGVVTTFLLAMPMSMSGMSSLLLLLIIHRVSISWNQTGQKWSHLEDLSDLLKTSRFLLPTVLLSILLLLGIRRHRWNWQYAIIVVLVLCLKAESLLPQLLPSSTLIPLIVVAVAFYLMLNFKGPLKSLSILTNIFILLTLVLQKLENIPLISLVVLQINMLQWVLPESPSPWSILRCVQSILVIWFSRGVFFYQGNSNSIAGIDVNAGYIGLTTYNEVTVGLLIVLNTFSLPSLALLAYLEQLEFGRRSFLEILVKSNASTVCIFSMVIFILRHHLFIWSVFTPKLLYVTGFTLYYGMILTVFGILLEIQGHV